MNRDTLLRTVAERCDEPLGIVEQIVDAALDEMMAAVEAGESVTLPGFGKLYAVQVPASPPVHDGYANIHFRPAREWRKRVGQRAAAQREAA